MKVILAGPRGFCAGVVMAIKTLETALQVLGKPVYVFHEIVHNRFVVERFRDLGAVFVNTLKDVPPGSTLLFSAHGISPRLRAQADLRGLRAIDATCPLVTKVHLEAIRFAREGYQIVLIGHAGHDEVAGTMGEAPDRIHLVESMADIEKLSFGNVPVAYLTQTTLSVDDAEKLIAGLRKKFPHIEAPSREDICYATQNRQATVRTLSAEADMVLVVGSANSSNSIRLTDVAKEQGVRSYLVDSRWEINPDWFCGVDTAVVTAGASVPEDLVWSVVDWIRLRYGATVEERVLKEEQVQFALPKEMRGLMNCKTAQTRC
jgi:4-hydroxy-3-methylbut-2-enyl diphosphate reductase